MRRTTAFFLSLAAMLSAACAPLNSDIINATPYAPTAAGPQSTPSMPDGSVGNLYDMEERSVYYPEGSEANSADYLLSYSVPVFKDTPHAAKMNEAVNLYVSELKDRVMTDRLPYADRADGDPVPETELKSEVSKCGEYINILFTERARFGDTELKSVFTLVLNGSGEETSLSAAQGMYEPEQMVAQQILNVIDSDRSRYYGDITLDDIVYHIDLHNGFIITQSGYQVFVASGEIAPDEAGEKWFEVSRESLYPDFVGDVMPPDQYKSLLPVLNRLACAAAPYYESFSGQPSPLVATAFMGSLMLDAGTAKMDTESFQVLYASYFEGDFPGLDSLGWNIYLENGSYSLGEYAPPGLYGVECQVALKGENGEVTVKCALMFGAPGDASSRHLANAEIILSEAQDAACGYRIQALLIG